jgi:hypothetical protein
MMISISQKNVCIKFGAEFVASPEWLKLGLSRDFSSTSYPLNGLRHPPENGTCGWFIWSGALLSQADDFFQPLHVSHIVGRCPILLKYLGLAPGWRFLVAPNHEDVWWDGKLLIT